MKFKSPRCAGGLFVPLLLLLILVEHRCNAMSCNARRHHSTARAGHLKAFHKVDLNIGKMGGVLDRPPGTVAFTESLEKCQKMSAHIS